MKLQKLLIENYRNFKRFEIAFEPDCTILIGENNSGKTNILDALYAGLRANRVVRQGAFSAHDFHLGRADALTGEAGPIRLTATFAERKPDEWSVQLVAALGDVVNVDPIVGTKSISIRVQGTAPSATADEEYDWAFLAFDGSPRSQKPIAILNRLQTLRPLERLDVLRDASKEFSQRSTYFGAFITEPKFDDALRASLLTTLGDINSKVLSAHAVFSVLKQNLDSGQNLIQATGSDVATIEAVPSRLSDLLANTQVSFQNSSGVSLPLNRHGSGTQSLSVLSLFRAYVEARLLARGEPLAEPILSIEEPESHLHPCGARAMWSLLRALPGQSIVTSHSGDLVGEAPLRCVRRVTAKSSADKAASVDESKFTQPELNNLNFYVRLSRGELLFANAWLLTEGKTELMLLQGVSRAAGLDLYAHGVRIIEHSSHGKPKPFIKLADQLGIFWHCLCDDDAEGAEYAVMAKDLLDGRPEVEHVTVLDAPNLEVFLCKHGFEAEYLAAVPQAKLAQLTAAPGTDAYYAQICNLMHKTEKTSTVLKVCDRIEANPALLPALLQTALRRCVESVA